MDIKCQRVLRITKIPGDYDGCRQNPDPSSGIYMDSATEAQCCIVAENWREQDEAKYNSVRVNAVKKAARITKQGSPLRRPFPR